MSLLTSLIAHWKLDEASGNAVDAHGSNTLTDNGSVGTAAGKINNSRDFNGTSQYFSIADNTNFSAGDVDFTFALWVRLDSIAATKFIVSKYNTGIDSREYYLAYLSGTNRFQFGVSASGGDLSASILADNLGAPAADTWYHVVCWHDAASNEIGIAVNGGTANTVGHSGGVYDGSSDFQLGALSTISSFFDGKIDEADFWKRVITSTERGDLYNGGSGLAYSSYGGGIAVTSSFSGAAGQKTSITARKAAGNAMSLKAGARATDTAQKRVSAGLSAISGVLGADAGRKIASTGIGAISGLLGAMQGQRPGTAQFSAILGALVNITHATARLATLQGRAGVRGSITGVRRATASLQALAGMCGTISGAQVGAGTRIGSFRGIAGAAATLAARTARISAIAARQGALGADTAKTIRRAEMAALAGLRVAIIGVNGEAIDSLNLCVVSARATYSCEIVARAAYHCNLSEAIVH